MHKINLIDHPVRVDKKAFLNAVNAQKPIAVTLDGEILEADGELPARPYIFVGKPRSLVGRGLVKPTPLSQILGESYEVKDEGDHISIYAGRAWEELIKANEPYYLYQDNTSEGIAEFTDSELDEHIWYSCEFGINCREVAEMLEKEVEGTLLCIETEKPYNFAGCAFVDDIETARKQSFDFIRAELEKKIASGEIDTEELEEAEEEALKYFGLL
ncbi:hypothetical protein [Hydrogenimonas sp. SS33]|uniref:hypothetical protein n=1 Tax=Hydrogenimonas leucolamina TaxID=2954236 RepID=UPI00336BF74B